MKFSLFNSMQYQGDDLPSGWPVPARHWDPEVGAASVQRGFELFDIAADHGFDWLTVAEHHYTPNELTPNAIVMAAAVSQRYPRVKIAALGPVLPMTNPVRTAEELAMLDALSGGRAVIGFLRGIPVEFLAYGTNPAETRAMYEEGIELVLRAWSEPLPFGWEGRHYSFRTVSVWPQPVQRPHPPLVLAGTSEESARFAARHHAIAGLSFLNTVEQAAALASIFRAEAAAHGWEPTSDDILFRARVYVAETDEQAETDARRYDLGNVLGATVPPPAKAAATQKILGAAFGGAGFRHRPPGPGSLPEYYGNPDTVARQIREASQRIGYGVADLIFDGHHLPHESAVRSLTLFGREVLPQLRDV